MATRGFSGKGRTVGAAGRLPPGQFVTEDFPVLSADPTPSVPLESWRFTLRIGPRPIKQWSWEAFARLPTSSITRDIHCVTRWSKFDTTWTGVSVDDILADAGIEPPAPFVLAHSVDGYTTNDPIQDLVGKRGMVATAFEGRPLSPAHGGPARLLVPHLYFWKSAKWVNGLRALRRLRASLAKEGKWLRAPI